MVTSTSPPVRKILAERVEQQVEAAVLDSQLDAHERTLNVGATGVAAHCVCVCAFACASRARRPLVQEDSSKKTRLFLDGSLPH
jgi:hypothetical protein